MRHLDREIDLETEDWSKAELRQTLEHAVSHARLWFRKNPGPREAGGLAGFSRPVALLYEQITGTEPGLGGELATIIGLTENANPFENKDGFLLIAGAGLVQAPTTTKRV